MTPCPSPFNLADYVLHHGQADDDKVALSILSTSRSERWSYGRLRSSVLGVATGLREAGLNPGDRLLLRLPNGVAFPLAYLGAIAAGIVPVPTSAQLTTPEVDALLPNIIPQAMAIGDGVPAPSVKLRTISEADILSMATLPAASPMRGDPERLAYIVFTSGTSGKPQAVAHAHRAIWARRMMWQGWYGLTPQDRLLHAGALNWTFTLGTGLLDPWAIGATALSPANGTALDALPLLLARHDATLFAAAPAALRRVLKTAQTLQVPKLRHTLTAGEHLHPALKQDWERATQRPLYDAYGMTECSTFLSAGPNGIPSLTAQPGRKVRVADDGAIAVHKDEPGLMLGYLEDGKVHLPLRDGWFHTTDRATQAPDGTITFQGRTSDLLNPGGVRVSPLEVEAVLATCPGITDVALTEVEVAPQSTILAALYCSDAPIAHPELGTFATKHLARYKQPRIWHRVPALPRGPNGKLDRKALPALVPQP